MSDPAAHLFEQANHARNAGKLDEAVSLYRQAIQFSPNYPGAHVNLGTVLAMQNRWDESAAAYRRAAQLAPGVPAIQYNLSNVLEAACAWDEALEVAQSALNQRPDDPLMLHHLGVALHNVGKFPEAPDAYSRALALKPDFPMAHCDLASLLILTGDFERGWREYEWRFKAVEPGRFHPKFTAANFWDGSALPGRRILIHTEGGFGDAINYFRYAPLIAQRGARVIVRCKRPLVELFRTLNGIAGVISDDEHLPDFDLHCPLFSLPRVIGTTVATIPTNSPYLSASAEKAAAWKYRLSNDRINVGLIWAGAGGHAQDRLRSMRLDDLAPLASTHARFYSLQKGEPSRQAQNPSRGLDLTDFSADLHDWTDTAALIDTLDLLISVDTAAAHLAGALAKPVWTAIQYVPDPRWLLNRSDTPWYPSMKLFRQSKRNDWADPIQKIAAELKELCAHLSPDKSA